MASLGFVDELHQNASRLQFSEQMLGKGLQQPFNNMNSGSRKILYANQQDQAFSIIAPEKAIIETGFEKRFADLSSSLITAPTDYVVLAKVPKFSHAPNHHYYLICKDLNSNEIRMFERISYKYKSECYGYLYNNSYMDSLQVNSLIHKGAEVRKTTGRDQFGNRMNGLNMNAVYMALDDNMEDSIVCCEDLRTKFAAPVFKYISIIVNENDIPRNLYGDDAMYKVMPDVGENIRDGIVCSFLMDRKDEAAYSQTCERLKQISISDRTFTVEKGTVMDINVYCNNPDQLYNNYYYAQYAAYYRDSLRFASDIVNIIAPLEARGFELEYQLEKLYNRSKMLLDGKDYKEKKPTPFSNIILEMVILEENLLSIGDKLADRYGGKGVVSKFLPRHMMPKMANGQYIDIIQNSSTMYNRENPGQNAEISCNYVSNALCEEIATGKYSLESCKEMIYDFIKIVTPAQDQADSWRGYIESLQEDEQKMYVNSVVTDGNIHFSTLPMSDKMSIDTIAALYERFPWIKQTHLIVPIIDSNGNPRYVPTRRPTVAAKKYMHRLEQFSEEKFSATSLSSTNIRNENAKSKASKNHTELYTATPIKFGSMESGNMYHMGVEFVISNLMIHSLSPHGRRLVEQMFTGDPFHVDIKLTSNAKNRSVEILNAFLKTIGLRMRFFKTRKKIEYPIAVNPIVFDKPQCVIEPIMDIPEGWDTLKMWKPLIEAEMMRQEAPFLIYPLEFFDYQQADTQQTIELFK